MFVLYQSKDRVRATYGQTDHDSVKNLFRVSASVREFIYTEPKKKFPPCLSADIHKYENQDETKFICIQKVFYCNFV